MENHPGGLPSVALFPFQQSSPKHPKGVLSRNPFVHRVYARFRGLTSPTYNRSPNQRTSAGWWRLFLALRMPPGKRHSQVPSQHRVEVRVVAGPELQFNTSSYAAPTIPLSISPSVQHPIPSN
ncbi:hypothetical protein HRG_012079 [Hirsutella rhossiliensis]